MSIASEITRIQGNIADAYTEANAKGATMPATQNSDNLASTIATISTGVTPTGTITITSNGITDVTNYANADVQVPTSAPALYREFQLDANGVLQPNTTTTHIMDFTGMTDVSGYALYAAYENNHQITGTIDMGDVVSLSGAYCCASMFRNNENINGFVLSSLTTVSGSNACGYMFYGCSGLTSANLPALTTISGSSSCGNMFDACGQLTSANLPALTTISGSTGAFSMFGYCLRLTSMTLPALTILTGASACKSMFAGCTSLTSLSFPALTSTSFGSRTNQFNGMLSGVTGCTVHFPSNLQAIIGSWSDVTSGFGGTNTTVLFDLPATS